MRRVAVTGMGVVAATGNNIDHAWQNIINGQTGIDRISLFDPADINVKIAGEVKDLAAEHVLAAKDNRRISRFIKFALVASHEAVQMAGDNLITDPDRAGCSIGVGIGALADIENNSAKLTTGGQRKVSPFFIPYTIPNMATGLVAKQHQLRGINLAPTAACASGNQGIGEAYRVIQRGDCDVMVCGGAEAAISPVGVVGFANMKALSTRNVPAASCPFDKQRDGFVIGEGAGILVLEEWQHAQDRGAVIFAELIGYGCNGEAYHISAPRPDGVGMESCMRAALQDAHIDAVDYINAHGTSTPMNDRYETDAITRLFSAIDKMLVSSTKSMTGHCLGAAGGIEAVFTVLALRDGIAPPTINLQDPDGNLNYVPNSAIERQFTYALSNSFGFGGVNATLIFAAPNAQPQPSQR
ncbi:MAG: beta-ketoacyl-ACP synthase II [Pseudomonadota bacterium]|nr:beta-ketoacyl-ACP synthase II [Pseudomonadota bacterium]